MEVDTIEELTGNYECLVSAQWLHWHLLVMLARGVHRLVDLWEWNADQTDNVSPAGRQTDYQSKCNRNHWSRAASFQSVSVFDADRWRNQIKTYILRSTDVLIQQNHTHAQICINNTNTKIQNIDLNNKKGMQWGKLVYLFKGNQGDAELKVRQFVCNKGEYVSKTRELYSWLSANKYLKNSGLWTWHIF